MVAHEHNMKITKKQEWIIYIELIQVYLFLDRACRTNADDSCIFCCQYGQETKLVSIHGHISFKSHKHWGLPMLSTRKTSFSRNDVDLPLEQTINRDAVSCQTGIAAFTESINARKGVQ